MKNLLLVLVLSLSINGHCQTPLAWPLQQSEYFNQPSYYYISNHVDHDPSTGLLDYNGGTRTYNGHDGTDIVLWPYWWKKMADEQVKVIAAANGIIINKDDGHADQSCAWTGGNWNYVAIQHSDGSIAYYGHLKNGSVTNQAIGTIVNQGDFLGYVGSSGNSDKPHLHFEIRKANGDLIDPFSGPSNQTNPNSWWIQQPNYQDSGLNYINTSNIIPEHYSQNCPDLEQTHEKYANQGLN